MTEDEKRRKLLLYNISQAIAKPKANPQYAQIPTLTAAQQQVLNSPPPKDPRSNVVKVAQAVAAPFRPFAEGLVALSGAQNNILAQAQRQNEIDARNAQIFTNARKASSPFKLNQQKVINALEDIGGLNDSGDITKNVQRQVDKSRFLGSAAQVASAPFLGSGLAAREAAGQYGVGLVSSKAIPQASTLLRYSRNISEGLGQGVLSEFSDNQDPTFKGAAVKGGFGSAVGGLAEPIVGIVGKGVGKLSTPVKRLLGRGAPAEAKALAKEATSSVDLSSIRNLATESNEVVVKKELAKILNDVDEETLDGLSNYVANETNPDFIEAAVEAARPSSTSLKVNNPDSATTGTAGKPEAPKTGNIVVSVKRADGKLEKYIPKSEEEAAAWKGYIDNVTQADGTQGKPVAGKADANGDVWHISAGDNVKKNYIEMAEPPTPAFPDNPAPTTPQAQIAQAIEDAPVSSDISQGTANPDIAQADLTPKLPKTIQDKIDNGVALKPEEQAKVDAAVAKVQEKAAKIDAARGVGQDPQALADAAYRKDLDALGKAYDKDIARINKVPEAERPFLAQKIEEKYANAMDDLEAKYKERLASPPEASNVNIPETRTLENPATKTTAAGNTRTIQRGQAGDDLGILQEQLTTAAKEGGVSNPHFTNAVETDRLITRTLGRGEVADAVREQTTRPIAQATTQAADLITTDNSLLENTIKDNNLLNWRGNVSKQDREAIGWALENKSNPNYIDGLANRTNNPDGVAAFVDTFSQWFEQKRDLYNQVLRDSGLPQKEIGKIEDYLPRMKNGNFKDSFLSFLNVDNGNPYAAPNTTAFQFGKKRTGQGEYSLDGIKAISAYIDSVNKGIAYTPAIQRVKAIGEIAKELETINPQASKQLTDLTERLVNQVTGKNGELTAAGALAEKATHLVGQGSVLYNLSVALSNTIPIIQAAAESSPKVLYNLGKSTLKELRGESLQEIDGFAVPFLKNRAGGERLSLGFKSKFKDLGAKVFQAPDQAVAHAITQSMYDDLIKAGAKPGAATAVRAGERAGNIMADRSAGMAAPLMKQRGVSKVFTQFQIEPLNQFNHLVNEFSRGDKNVGEKALLAAKLALYGWIGNQVYTKITGQRKAIDPVGAIQVAVQKSKSADPGKEWQTIVGSLLNDTLQQLPFGNQIGSAVGAVLPDQASTAIGLGGSLSGSGRALGGSLVGSVTDIGKNAFAQDKSKAIRATASLVPGGNQAYKTISGINAFAQGGVSKPDKNGKQGDVRFAINQNPVELVRAAAFGKYATTGGRNYINSGFQTPQDAGTTKGNDTNGIPKGLKIPDYYSDAQRKAAIDEFNRKQAKEDITVPKQYEGLIDQSDNTLKTYVKDGTISQEDYNAIQGFKKAKSNVGVDKLVNVNSDLSKAFYKKADALTADARKAFLSGPADGTATKMTEDINKQLLPGLSQVTPSNKIANLYANFDKDVLSNKDISPNDKRQKTRTFWTNVAKQNYGDDIKEIYDGTIGDIQNLEDVGDITKEQLDKAIALDNELLAAKLRTTPKFSNKFRNSYGYAEAGSGSGGSGGGGGSKSSPNMSLEALLGDLSAKGFDLSALNRIDTTPSRPTFKVKLPQPISNVKRVQLKL